MLTTQLIAPGSIESAAWRNARLMFASFGHSFFFKRHPAPQPRQRCSEELQRFFDAHFFSFSAWHPRSFVLQSKDEGQNVFPIGQCFTERETLYFSTNQRTRRREESGFLSLTFFLTISQKLCSFSDLFFDEVHRCSSGTLSSERFIRMHPPLSLKTKLRGENFFPGGQSVNFRLIFCKLLTNWRGSWVILQHSPSRSLNNIKFAKVDLMQWEYRLSHASWFLTSFLSYVTLERRPCPIISSIIEGLKDRPKILLNLVSFNILLVSFRWKSCWPSRASWAENGFASSCERRWCWTLTWETLRSILLMWRLSFNLEGMLLFRLRLELCPLKSLGPPRGGHSWFSGSQFISWGGPQSFSFLAHELFPQVNPKRLTHWLVGSQKTWRKRKSLMTSHVLGQPIFNSVKGLRS